MGQGNFKYESVNQTMFAKPSKSVSYAKRELDKIVNRVSADNVAVNLRPKDAEI